MKNDIYSNIKDSDALRVFECMTSCDNNEEVDCANACYLKHLEPNNVNYPNFYKLIWKNLKQFNSQILMKQDTIRKISIIWII